MNRLLLFSICLSLLNAQQHSQKARNVIFVMSDGLRWQEVFSGADPALISKESGVTDIPSLRRDFWRDSPSARRAALMPFLWTEIAQKGQIFGNRGRASDAFVTNGLNFSYPGYSEIFCGFPDDRIDSNDKKPNPNLTVLEWLNRKPDFKDRIAAFGAWDAFPFILNSARGGFFVNAGYDPLTLPPVSPQIALLNRLKTETGVWDGEPFDAFTFLTALEYFKQHKPRVLYLSLGETDEWAHDGKYHHYLKAAHRVDQYIKELWDTAQSMPEYRGTTALIVAVDHGRGLAPVEWKSHGQKVPDSKYLWMAFLGPGVAPLGERSNIQPVTQSQVAATLAALLGEDYNASVPKAGKPIPLD